MKIIAINGSPRRHGNTAVLLQHALQGAEAAGAETTLYHLYDQPFQGCTSCFACKRKGNPFAGKGCAYRDALSPVLEACMQSKAIIIGSPMYLGDVTGAMRSFLERLIFPMVTYEADNKTPFAGRIDSAAIYSMGLPEVQAAQRGYEAVFHNIQSFMQRLNGTSSYMTSCDALQFDRYDDYQASRYNEADKRHVYNTQFPKDCARAEALGRQLAASI